NELCASLRRGRNEELTTIPGMQLQDGGFCLGRPPGRAANSTASSSPFTYSRGDHVSILWRAATLIRSRILESEKNSRKTAAKASTFVAGNTKPFTLWRTRSYFAPTRSLTATGQPHTMTSFTTNPKGS